MRACGLLLVTLVFVPAACAPYASRGESLYQEGRHIEAAEVFEVTEARLRDETDETRASYGLYRGLNFLKLGDVKGARHWLIYAGSVERKAPGSLSTDDQVRLRTGWKAVEEASRGASGPPVGESRVASTDEAAPRGTGPATNGRRSLVAE